MLPWCRLFILITTLAIASPVFAVEWFKAYMKGKDQAKSGNCTEAKANLQEALRQNPNPDLHATTYGTQRMEYIPHYYLALCAFHEGDLKLALRYAKDAELSHVRESSKAKEFAAFEARLQAQLQAQAQEKKPPPPEQKPVVPPAEQKPPPQQVTPPKTIPTPTPEERNRALAQKALEEAVDAMTAGRYDDAREASNRVLLIDSKNAEAKRILSEISRIQAKAVQDQERQKRLLDVQNALRTGDLTAAENLIADLKKQFPSDSYISSLSREVQRRKDAKVLQEQEAVARKNLEKQEADTRKNLEKQVLIAYYHGQYQTAIQLARDALQKTPDSWRLHFFMGCSYAALSFLEEENKEGRLDLARDSFRKARAGNSRIDVPPHISPKILEIYRTS